MMRVRHVKSRDTTFSEAESDVQDVNRFLVLGP